jgi:ABC-type transport system substrate-binding protein
MKTFAILGLALVSLLGCTRSKEVVPPKENVMRMPLKDKISSLDPHVTHDVYSLRAQGLFYESLYQYHYLKRPLELEPLLAESMPTISKDNKTFTFKLKKGVRYHDHPCFTASGGKGREVVAEDFSYMIHRVSAPKFVSPVFSAFEKKLVGVDDYHAGKVPTISGIKVLDSHAFQLTLLTPSPRFIYNFINAHTAPLPKECVEKLGDELARTELGTGPFLLKEYNAASKVVAVRNPEYRKMTYPGEGKPGDKEAGLLEDAGKPVPFLDKVVYEILIEDNPTWLKFMAGETEVSRIPKDNMAGALPGGKLSPELLKRGVKHLTEVEGDVTVWIFNMDDPVWGKKKELRQAFALALDMPRMIETIYASMAVRAHSLVDPTQYGYDPNWKSRWATRDIAKAKELLAKAGYPDGKGLPPVEMPTTTSATARQMNELLVKSLSEAGIVLKPIAMTWPELSKSLRTKKFTVAGIGYASDTPDADTAFAQLHSRNAAPGPNAASYRNAEVDKLIDEVEMMRNGPERYKRIRKVLEIVDDELPYVTGVHRIGNQLTQPWVRNHVFTDDMFWGNWLKYKKIIPASGG